jgi:hypothetical protein
MSDLYRARALWHLRQSESEADLDKRAEHLKLAMSYIRLAALAEKNAATDIVYETPPCPRGPVDEK